MGFKAFTLAGAGILLGWAVHRALDTPYDWLAFLTAVVLFAWAFPDDVLDRWAAMARWSMREGIKYSKRVGGGHAKE